MAESRLQNLLFAPLKSDGSNFLEWLNDARTVLCAEDLAKALTHNPPASLQSTSAEETDEPPLLEVSK